MGKQYNKAEKRKRRTRYLKRKVVAAKQKQKAKAVKAADAVAPAYILRQANKATLTRVAFCIGGLRLTAVNGRFGEFLQ